MIWVMDALGGLRVVFFNSLFTSFLFFFSIIFSGGTWSFGKPTGRD